MLFGDQVHNWYSDENNRVVTEKKKKEEKNAIGSWIVLLLYIIIFYSNVKFSHRPPSCYLKHFVAWFNTLFLNKSNKLRIEYHITYCIPFLSTGWVPTRVSISCFLGICWFEILRCLFFEYTLGRGQLFFPLLYPIFVLLHL